MCGEKKVAELAARDNIEIYSLLSLCKHVGLRLANQNKILQRTVFISKAKQEGTRVAELCLVKRLNA